MEVNNIPSQNCIYFIDFALRVQLDFLGSTKTTL